MSTQNVISVMPASDASLQQRLKDVVEKTPMAGRHSYFQLKYFIINKEPTVQAKLWQCLREMKARKEALEGIVLEQEDICDKIALAKLELVMKPRKTVYQDMPDTDEEILEREIKVRQMKRRLLSLEKSLAELAARQKDTEEEAAFFLMAFEELEKIEKVKSYDDAEAQMEYWSSRFSHDMNMKLMVEHRVDVELAKAILSMPDAAVVKQELVGFLTQQQNAIETQRLNQKKQLEASKLRLQETNG